MNLSFLYEWFPGMIFIVAYYDIVGNENINEQYGNVYGDVNDDLEFETVQNPYYEGDDEINAHTNIIETPDPNTSHAEVITVTKNDYYEM